MTCPLDLSCSFCIHFDTNMSHPQHRHSHSLVTIRNKHHTTICCDLKGDDDTLISCTAIILSASYGQNVFPPSCRCWISGPRVRLLELKKYSAYYFLNLSLEFWSMLRKKCELKKIDCYQTPKSQQP